MQTSVTVPCPLPGFEAVKATYNMMATGEQWDAFYRNGDGDGVASVENWDHDAYPDGPEGNDAPLAWQLWYRRKGSARAIQEFVADPN